MPEPPFFRAKSGAVAGIPHIGGAGAGPAFNLGFSSLDEERREIVAGVLSVLAGNPPDADQMAACSYLLKHLSATAGRHAAWPFPPQHRL